MTDRRPLASRDTGWARMITRKLAATQVTPNQISIASIGFAAVAGFGFYMGARADGFGGAVALLVAALCCQLRLLCNLFDGLVAVEAGKGSPDGAYWNEAPDRISDVFIFVGLGLGVGLPGLGWAAAAMAIGTAYVRELGRATDGVNDFSGPMAKPQRMAVLTIAAIVACLAPLWGATGLGLLIATLWLVLIGSAATSVRRSMALIGRLNARV
ncbi:MAG: CDP-alcohol phosphatidyltransferase family protein [Roseovarius sp.]